MKSDPNPNQLTNEWMEHYEKNNYKEGVVGYLLTKSHQWSESSFTQNKRFPKVLEVGAGTGMHFQHVKHAYDEYWMTDRNQKLVQLLKTRFNQNKKMIIRQEDATSLSFAGRSFDRLIAAHILEHLYKPHLVLREWARVVKPGGTLTILLPCDPGLLWRLGRAISVRPRYTKLGFEYDYFMAREHVNPINGLIALIRYYFDHVEEKWLPFGIPSIDMNLFYIANISI